MRGLARIPRAVRTSRSPCPSSTTHRVYCTEIVLGDQFSFTKKPLSGTHAVLGGKRAGRDACRHRFEADHLWTVDWLMRNHKKNNNIHDGSWIKHNQKVAQKKFKGIKKYTEEKYIEELMRKNQFWKIKIFTPWSLRAWWANFWKQLVLCCKCVVCLRAAFFTNQFNLPWKDIEVMVHSKSHKNSAVGEDYEIFSAQLNSFLRITATFVWTVDITK